MQFSFEISWWRTLISVLLLPHRCQGHVSLPQRGPDPDPIRLLQGRDRQDEGWRRWPHEPRVRCRSPGQAHRGREERIGDGSMEQGASLLHPRHGDGALHPLHHHRHDRQVDYAYYSLDSIMFYFKVYSGCASCATLADGNHSSGHCWLLVFRRPPPSCNLSVYLAIILQ